MADDAEAIQLTITTTVGSFVVTMRVVDARAALADAAPPVVRDGRVVPITDLSAAQFAQYLASLWMHRAMEATDALIYGLDPGKFLAVHPKAIMAITGVVVRSPAKVGFGSGELQ